MQVSNSFTAVGVGTEISVRKGDSIYYAVSGTFSGSWQLQANVGKRWVAVASGTAAGSGTVTAEAGTRYRMACVARASGTITGMIDEEGPQNSVLYTVSADTGKVGATAGWAPRGANNLIAATLPASQTNSTLVIPLPGLRVGDEILGFSLLGQIESAGNTASISANLRKMTGAAADLVDASVASMTQLSVTADTLVNRRNARATNLTVKVGEGEMYYLLITGTTGLATDIALLGASLELKGNRNA
jgi:hypothetical protein